LACFFNCWVVIVYKAVTVVVDVITDLRRVWMDLGVAIVAVNACVESISVQIDWHTSSFAGFPSAGVASTVQFRSWVRPASKAA
jgi:hypothetical protein